MTGVETSVTTGPANSEAESITGLVPRPVHSMAIPRPPEVSILRTRKLILHSAAIAVCTPAPSVGTTTGENLGAIRRGAVKALVAEADRGAAVEAVAVVGGTGSLRVEIITASPDT